MELTAGLFALGRVAMTALLGELRAWRESGIKQTAELNTLRRETFTRALHDVEAVASSVALWAGTMPDQQESEAKFWAALCGHVGKAPSAIRSRITTKMVNIS